MLELIKSGTSNLQAAFLNLPQMMFYLAPKFSQFIVYNFVKIKEYSLPNIVRPHSIFEVTGPDVTRPVLVKELEALLFDAQKRAEIKKNYLEIVANLTQYDQNPVLLEQRAHTSALRGWFYRWPLEYQITDSDPL